MSGGCFRIWLRGSNASVALLRVDGEAIAAQVLMYCGTTAYTWKTAFDASYAKYSPGTLLIDRITDELFAGSGIVAINSCAAEASFMGQLWAGRRTMVDMLVDVGPGKSLAYRMEGGRQVGYQCLRSLRDRFRNRNLTPVLEETGHGIAAVSASAIYYPGNISSSAEPTQYCPKQAGCGRPGVAAHSLLLARQRVIPGTLRNSPHANSAGGRSVSFAVLSS